MNTTESLEIIENMYLESKKTLHRNAFYFLAWGILLFVAGMVEYIYYGQGKFWIVWPLVSGIGIVASFIYGFKEGRKSGGQTSSDRITSFTSGAFGFALALGIVYAVKNQLPPHAISLMMAGAATFISGGISKFNPFIIGGILLELGAIICGFLIDDATQGLVFALSIFAGYIIPGIMLRKVENG